MEDVRLIQGDCLDVLKTLDSGISPSWLNDDMAGIAEGNEIRQVVCFPIIGEVSIGDNVVNVQREVKIGLSYLASLASVVVALLCCGALLPPVRPAIRTAATAPSRIVAARLPFTKADFGTEITFRVSLTRRWPPHSIAAIQTGDVLPLFLSSLFASPRTEAAIGNLVSRVALEIFPTILAATDNERKTARASQGAESPTSFFFGGRKTKDLAAFWASAIWSNRPPIGARARTKRELLGRQQFAACFAFHTSIVGKYN